MSTAEPLSTRLNRHRQELQSLFNGGELDLLPQDTRAQLQFLLLFLSRAETEVLVMENYNRFR